MQMVFRDARSLRAAVAAALLLLLGACGGGGGGGGGRPDMSLVEKKLADNANALTEGQARLVEFKETRCEKTDEMEGVVNWEVRVEGVMEIDGPCYFLNKERAKGDRVKFEYTTNMLHDANGQWIQEPGRIDEI